MALPKKNLIHINIGKKMVGTRFGQDRGRIFPDDWGDSQPPHPVINPGNK